LKCDIAGGIVDPLDFEVRVDMKVIANEFIAHVVNSKQMPDVLSDLDVLLCEVWDFPLVEKL
jgi:hypothetical protein